MKRSKVTLSAIQLMIQGAFAFSLMALCVRVASHTLPSLEIVFFRSLFGVLMMLYLIQKNNISLLGKERKIMTCRGISGFLALTLHFYTIAHLPLGTAVILNYTAPIFVAILATFFLGEQPSRFLIGMILMSFTGVLLLVEGRFESWNLMVLLGLLSAVLAAIAYVLIRAVKKREHPYTIIFYFTGVSTLGSLCYLPFGFVWPDPKAWLALLGVAIGSFFGQVYLTTALRRADSSLLSPFSYLSPLLTYLYGFLFFAERIGILSVLGVILIILGGSLISIYETKQR